MFLGLPPNKGLYRDDAESNFTGLMKGEFGQVHAAAQEEEKAVAATPVQAAVGAVLETEESAQLGKQEAVSVPSHCPNCSYLGELLTCITEIPHFKEVSLLINACRIYFVRYFCVHR